jgi:hypothetical protein
VAAAFLRDPYPREADGFRYSNLTPRATICRDITSWSLVMQPGAGRLWISDTEIPAAQGRFFAFDLPGWRRLPDRDLAPTGYQAARRCAEHYLAGDQVAARAELTRALALDGAAAPLLLMQAVLYALAGEEKAAGEILEQGKVRWAGTPAGALARAWQVGENMETGIVGDEGFPFPSAIRPLLHLRPGGSWEERAVPLTSRSRGG